MINVSIAFRRRFICSYETLLGLVKVGRCGFLNLWLTRLESSRLRPKIKQKYKHWGWGPKEVFDKVCCSWWAACQLPTGHFLHDCRREMFAGGNQSLGHDRQHDVGVQIPGIFDRQAY